MASASFDPAKLYIRNVGISNGLSQCVVSDLHQDNNGFLWIATFDGLNRFDGSNIKIFRHDPDDPSSIISSKIFKIISDNNNHLFLSTSDGICYFDCKTEKIFKPSFLKKYTPVWFGKSNSEQDYWLYTKDKLLVKVSSQTMVCKEYLSLTNLNQSNLNVIKVLENGTSLYIVLENGDIVVYDDQTKLSKIIKSSTLNWVRFTDATFDKYQNVIITSKSTDLLLFDTKLLTFLKSDFYDKNKMLIGIEKVIYDSLKDILYMPSYGQGLFVYDYKTNKIKQYKSKGHEFPISSNYILTMRTNKNGSLFIAYDGSGVDVVDPFVKKFKPISSNSDNEYENIKYVRKIVEGRENDLFIGTSESGLVKYNRMTGQFTFYSKVNNFNDAYSFVLEMQAYDNELWVGYNGKGIGVFDINTMNPIRKITQGHASNQLSGGTIWFIFKENEHTMWIGTNGNGINKLNLDNYQIKQYSDNQYIDFVENGVRVIMKYRDDKLMLGTEKGVFLFDKKSENITKIFPKSEKENSFKNIKSIFQDYKKRYWLSTDGGGIVVVDTNFNLIKNFNTNNGLNNNVVYGILPQDQNTFWLSSNSGICKIAWNEDNLYNKTPLVVHCYDEVNGLQSNEFNTGAYSLLSDSSIVFGGLNGINIFNPKEIELNPIKPKVCFTEFKIFENPLESDVNIAYLDNVNLKYYENSISIGFNTIGFLLPEKVLYKYRLLGYEKNWVTPTIRNYVSYTNLPSGKYQFQVVAMNYDGIWDETPKTLSIFIKAPFYKTWWFYTIFTLFVGVLTYIFYLYRTKQMKDKEKIKLQFTKELAEVEMKALRAQINPHFLFNSLNSINNFILKNDTKNASKYLIKFSQLVRSVLNNSSTAFVTIHEELQTIELYLIIEGMRFGNQFTYKIISEDGLNIKLFYIPSLLLQPYVENAIWHGLLHKEGEKHILITIKKNNEKSIAISILDNGIGREMAASIKAKKDKQKSFGMKLGESRLRLLNESYGGNASVNVVDLYDSMKIPIGTRIDIIIPLKSNVIESN